jgi:hypothetical protein
LTDSGHGTGRGLGESYHADGTLRVSDTEEWLTSEKETAGGIKAGESGRGERGKEQWSRRAPSSEWGEIERRRDSQVGVRDVTERD